MEGVKENIKKDYIRGLKQKEICERYNISINTLKSWIKRYKWVEEKRNKGAPINKKGAPIVIDENKEKARKVAEKIVKDENLELTEKQRLFCMYYIKNKNATMSAIKAGYSKDSAYVEGSRLLRNAKVVEEIKRLKIAIREELLIDEFDVIQEYMKIAFSDITDYVEFGTEEVETEEGRYTKSYVRFKQDFEVDGTIISEVSQGKDGAKIKLYDKIKALEYLDSKIGMLDLVTKEKLENEKIKIAIAKEKLELEKYKTLGDEDSDNNEAIQSFLKATSMSEEDIKALFGDEEGEEDGTT